MPRKHRSKLLGWFRSKGRSALTPNHSENAIAMPVPLSRILQPSTIQSSTSLSPNSNVALCQTSLSVPTSFQDPDTSSDPLTTGNNPPNLLRNDSNPSGTSGSNAVGTGSSSSTASNQNAQRPSLWSKAKEGLSADDRKIIDLCTSESSDSISVVLSKLVDEILKKQDECDQGRWKLNFKGQEIILRDVAAKIISCIDNFRSIGDIVANVDPIHVGLPWAAFRFLLQVSHRRARLLRNTNISHMVAL